MRPARLSMRRPANAENGVGLLLVTVLLGFGYAAVAASLDSFGPPPADDPSTWTGPIAHV